MDYVWKVVRKIKLGVSFGKTCSSDALYKDIDSNIDEVERILEVTASDERFGNVTDSSLKTAADMFLYLNSCNENLRPWFIFYTDLIRNKSPNEIILTLNRILKNQNNLADKDLINIARKLFDKLSSTFTMQFQDIQSYTSCTGNDSLNGLTKGDLNNFKIKLNTIFEDLTSANHPVHLVYGGGQKLSPSAFIPFCEFGGSMSAMGIKIDQFKIPVCNSFQAKILNDQLCYEVDLNKYSNKYNIKAELKSGFIFIMDYNEDRQITFNKECKLQKTENGISFAKKVVKSDELDHAFIYLDTVGKY